MKFNVHAARALSHKNQKQEDSRSINPVHRQTAWEEIINTLATPNTHAKSEIYQEISVCTRRTGMAGGGGGLGRPSSGSVSSCVPDCIRVICCSYAVYE